MDCGESGEERAQIVPHVFHLELAKVISKVTMPEVGEDGNDLIMMAESSDKRTNGVGVLEIMEKLKLVENATRTACYVYLLDGNISPFCCDCFGRLDLKPAYGDILLFLNIPVILMAVVLKIFSLVYC